MKVVLVSQNITFVKNRAEYQDGLDQRFTKFLQKANLVPYMFQILYPKIINCENY